MFNLKKKVLFGVAASMVLAMAVGSFALGENQTPASPQEVEAQNAVGANVGAFTVNGGTQGTDYEFTGTSGTDGVLTIHPQSAGTNITISNTGTTTDRIEVTSAATITLAGVNIDRSSITGTNGSAALTITDNANFDVKILLADNTTNILKGAAGNNSTSPFHAGSPGIEKSDDGSVDIDTLGTLTIGVPDGSAETGKLESTGGYKSAGIGGGYNGSGSNITITGGEVTAIGGSGGAGIGGGNNGSGSAGTGSDITITGGKVTATGGSSSAGIGGGYYGSGSNITITGGEVTANGGSFAAGIGGGQGGSGSDITITGGLVTATGRTNGAGIGGGSAGTGSDITINGGVVTATGGTNGAGIGGGRNGSGSDITINGGVVTATGGTNGAGIGGGSSGSASGNSLNGDAVVLATSGDAATKPALEGFENDQQESLLTQGIAFTGLGTAFDSDGYVTDITWDSNGTMYGNVTLSQDLEIPANLTVPAGQILSIKEGKDVTLSEETGAKYTVEGELRNNGIVTLPDDLEVNDEGKVTTAIIYDTQGGRIANADEYKTYQDSSEIKAYSELPNAEKDGYLLEGWYTEKDGEGTKVEETSLVLLNQHILYANWTANPEPSPEPEPEPIPDPSVEPGHGGDGSDASSKTGDSFAGIAALAILGLATTGAALLRKRK